MKKHVISFMAFFISGLLFLGCDLVPKKQPVMLLTEFSENPMGMDVSQPRFSWIVNDTTRGAGQSAYQIVMSTSLKSLNANDADVWNTEKVNSNQSHLIPYTGPELESGKRYYWMVRVWDNEDAPTNYSAPAWFETGLLQKSDWRAKWIAGEIPHKVPGKKERGMWVQSPFKNIDSPGYFRSSFNTSTEKEIKNAILRITSMGGSFRTHLNGRFISQGSDYKQFFHNNITLYLKPGLNVLATRINANGSGKPSMIYHIQIEYADGSTEIITSNSADLAIHQEEDGWTTLDFEDDAWQKVTVAAPFGDGIWGDSTRIMDPPTPIAMRNEIKLAKKVKSARAYVTGLGSYVFYINGKRVGEDLLTPGWTHYPKKVQYQAYNVTEQLQKGENVLGALLGNVWWSSGLGWSGGAFYDTGPLRFLAQLHITYDDDTQEVFITNEDWSFDATPITYSTLYHGEFYDARLEDKNWSSTGFDSEDWKSIEVLNDYNPELVSQHAPTIRVTETLKPVSIDSPKENVYVFDFGQNMVGRGRLKIDAEKGQKIIMRFAELLHDDGTVAQENLRSAKATDMYIAHGEGIEEWAPDFTYHGFRYVQVEGLTEKPDESLLTGEVFHNAEPLSGSFTSSNDLLNQIWKNTLWGQRGNMMSVPTDCPQRDERLGWMGDAQVFASTANYNMFMPSFWAKWTHDILDCQEPEGWVYDVNPAIVVGGPSKPAWGDAVTIVPWHNYLFFADKGILKESYDGMKAWVEYMTANSENYVYEWGEGEWGGYGDWVAVEPSPTKPIGGVYYYYSTKLLAKAAEVLGKKEDAAKYHEQAEKIAEAFHQKYFNESTMNYLGATQTANLLPLVLGITPSEVRNAVTQNLVENVIDHDYHQTTGFLGTKYLLPYLSANGYHDIAYRVATQTTYPSWGYMVKKGATTMWELWDSDTQPPEAMNSRNHFAYGSVVEWYYSHLAGIQPLEEAPGYEKIKIAPMPVDDLNFVEASSQTPYGEVISRWEKTNDEFILEIIVPWNTKAEVVIPNPENKQVIENNVVIYDGLSGNDTKNVRIVNINDDNIVVNVGGGHYVFTVR